MTDNYQPIIDSIVRRMARAITVRPQVNAEFPYVAYIPLAGETQEVAPRHPRALTFEATTPIAAVCGLVDLLGVWISDPRSPFLLVEGAAGRRRSPGLELDDGAVALGEQLQ